MLFKEKCTRIYLLKMVEVLDFVLIQRNTKQ